MIWNIFLSHGFIVESPQQRTKKNEISSGEIFFIINQSEEHKSRCMWKQRTREKWHKNMTNRQLLCLLSKAYCELPELVHWASKHYNVIITFFVLIMRKLEKKSWKCRKIRKRERAERYHYCSWTILLQEITPEAISLKEILLFVLFLRWWKTRTHSKRTAANGAANT